MNKLQTKKPMRVFYLATSLMTCLLLTAKVADSSSNTIPATLQINTNGLSCGMWFLDYVPPLGSFEQDQGIKLKAPVCEVYGMNITTNRVIFLQMPPTNLFKIDLVDAWGNFVEKTSEGRMYGLPLTREQVSKWYHKMNSRYGSGYVSFFSVKLTPDDIDNANISRFSFLPAFQVRQPGEYTLHLTMRLIQPRRAADGQIYFPMTWLPEATAKVQIRPEDIAPTNSNPQIQTNTMSR